MRPKPKTIVDFSRDDLDVPALTKGETALFSSDRSGFRKLALWLKSGGAGRVV